MKNVINSLPGFISLVLTFLFIINISSNIQAQEEIVLRFHDNTSPDTIAAMLQEFNATEITITPISKFRLWHLDSMMIDLSTDELLFFIGTDTLSIQETGKKARNKVSMLSADPNFVILTPEFEDEFPCAQHLVFPPADNCEIRVAVIDTGTDEWHHDLAGTFWQNVDEYPSGANNIDEDNNNYIDDLIGYDFYNSAYSPIDLQSHGTHISGTIMQVAQQQQFNNIKTISLKALNSSGKGTIFSIIEAVDYAISMDAHIINMSFGYTAKRSTSGKPAALEYVINLAGQMSNSLVICSAGNVGQNIDTTYEGHYPAGFSCDNLISVAAVACDTSLAYFSNYGQQSVDLGAPGVIYSTIPNNRWAFKTGTSMSAAVVSGTAALLGTYSCPFDYALVKAALLNSVDPANLPLTTRGYLNPINALNYLLNPPLPRKANTEEVAPISISPNPFENQVTISWNEIKEGKTRLEIYNSLGQLLQAQSIEVYEGKNQFQLNLEETSYGAMLFLVLKTQNRIYSYPLFRQSNP